MNGDCLPLVLHLKGRVARQQAGRAFTDGCHRTTRLLPFPRINTGAAPAFQAMHTGRGKIRQMKIGIEISESPAGDDSDGTAGNAPDILEQPGQTVGHLDRFRARRNVYKRAVEIEEKGPVRDWERWRLQNVDHNLAG